MTCDYAMLEGLFRFSMSVTLSVLMYVCIQVAHQPKGKLH